MNDTPKSIIKKILAVAFFLLVMLLTFYVVFNGQDIDGIVSALGELNGFFMILALSMALMYIVCEGYMIWMMVGGKWSIRKFLRCTGYSFIGFFYSGITPSASGGQPMQLYYMSRDGLRFSKSCAALTVIAATNKFVLASLGVILLIFWNGPLHDVFEDHMGWYYLGLIVLVFWVIVLAFLMYGPNVIQRVLLRFLAFLEKIHILKPSSTRDGKVISFFDGYRDIMHELNDHKKKIVIIGIISYFQRFCLVALTYVIYKGFGLAGTSAVKIILVQLAIMIAVDMLPLPGAQGISEFLYRRVFATVFVGDYLTASMCVTRLSSFYFLLILGMLVVAVKTARKLVKSRKKVDNSL